MPAKPPPSKRTVLLATSALLLAVAGGGLAGLLSGEVRADAEHQTPQERAAIKHATDLSLAFKQATRSIAPSVVNIVAIQRVGGTGGQQDPRSREFEEFLDDEFFERFFGTPRQPGQQPRRPRQRRGQGSGLIIRPDGHIVTNNHVVEGATRIEVTLDGGRPLAAEVVGTDDLFDLAVIKIDADDLTAARFADSDALEIGQWVLAVGNPFGLNHTVTAGIVSAKGRSRVGVADYEDFIQTDAAINPGNSGGPLVNLRGEVVGLNTAIATRNGGYMGVGFAIPSNIVRSVTEIILESGKVVRGWLGVQIQMMDEDLAASFNYAGEGGVLITHVEPGSPADEAGQRRADIIVSLDGQPMDDSNRVRHIVALLGPDKVVEMNVFRDDETRTVRVRLGEWPDDQGPRARRSGAESSDEFGVTVVTITPEIAERIGSPHEEGVVVTEVEPDSMADRAGILPTDVIVQFGDREIRDVADFRRALRDFDPGKGVRIRLHRGIATVYIFVK